jgi:prevent-host-death family protein
MRVTVSATKARVHFGEVMQRVEDTDEMVIVERGGRPKVAIISVKQLDELERRAKGEEVPHWKVLQQQVRELIRQAGNVPLNPPPEEVIREMREERNARITNLP